MIGKLKNYRSSLVTVIGGAGFLGMAVCEELSRAGHDFEIIDIVKSTIFPKKSRIADVRDLKSLAKEVNGDAIINLAAVHSDDVNDYEEYYATNVVGAKNTIAIAEKKKKRDENDK